MEVRGEETASVRIDGGTVEKDRWEEQEGKGHHLVCTKPLVQHHFDDECTSGPEAHDALSAHLDSMS